MLYFGDAPWGRSRYLYDVLDVPEFLKEYVSDYRINVFEIAHLPEDAIEYFHSDFRVLVDFLIKKRNNPDYRPTNPQKFKHVRELLALMAAITKDNRYVEIYEQGGGPPENMCEVLDRAEERGRKRGEQEGLRKGIRKGVRKGVRKGRQEAVLSSIQSLMTNMSWTATQAMNALGIPEEEQKNYLQRL